MRTTIEESEGGLDATWRQRRGGTTANRDIVISVRGHCGGIPPQRFRQFLLSTHVRNFSFRRIHFDEELSFSRISSCSTNARGVNHHHSQQCPLVFSRSCVFQPVGGRNYYCCFDESFMMAKSTVNSSHNRYIRVNHRYKNKCKELNRILIDTIFVSTTLSDAWFSIYISQYACLSYLCMMNVSFTLRAILF